jgi:nucleoside 2-deoxyribosyltransferase
VKAERTHEAVYLAGAITGLSYGDALGWRLETAGKLMELGYDVLSPMRHKLHLKDEFEQKTLPAHHALFRDPFARDMHDIERSTYVIVNMTPSHAVGPSVGTLVELGTAWARGKYIIVVDGLLDDDPDYKLHPFVNGCARDVFATLDEAVDLLAEYRPLR